MISGQMKNVNLIEYALKMNRYVITTNFTYTKTCWYVYRTETALHNETSEYKKIVSELCENVVNNFILH